MAFGEVHLVIERELALLSLPSTPVSPPGRGAARSRIPRDRGVGAGAGRAGRSWLLLPATPLVVRARSRRRWQVPSWAPTSSCWPTCRTGKAGGLGAARRGDAQPACGGSCTTRAIWSTTP